MPTEVRHNDLTVAVKSAMQTALQDAVAVWEEDVEELGPHVYIRRRRLNWEGRYCFVSVATSDFEDSRDLADLILRLAHALRLPYRRWLHLRSYLSGALIHLAMGGTLDDDDDEGDA